MLSAGDVLLTLLPSSCLIMVLDLWSSLFFSSLTLDLLRLMDLLGTGSGPLTLLHLHSLLIRPTRHM